MQLIQLRLCHVLLITTVLYFPERIIANCDDWHLKGSDEVCCNRCKPGNRLVEECGLKPSELCVPCSPNSYTNEALAVICKKCTQCISPLIQLKPCNSSKDTVCGCKTGFRCGNEQCKFCVVECKEGQEPTYLRSCTDCPDGTFNDKIHSFCKPWRKRCPDGEIMTARGSKSSDIKCSKIPKNTTTTLAPEGHTSPKADNKILYLLLACFGVSSAITFGLILALWLAYKRTKNKNKSKDPTPTTTTASHGELSIIMVENDEAPSYRQPEQEQGGSSESIDTQGSETKLIM